MEPWLEKILTIVLAVFTCSGFWAYLINRREKRDREKAKEEEKNSASNLMLVGLGHDRIVYLSMKYIERGGVSNDEYEDLMNYLYAPYKQLGGNGTAERIIEEVKHLPIRKISHVQQAQQNAQMDMQSEDS